MEESRNELMDLVEQVRESARAMRQERDAARAELAAAQQRLVEAGAKMRAQADELAAARGEIDTILSKLCWTSAKLDTITAERDAALKELRAVEWVTNATGLEYCPRCKHKRAWGHASDCQLAAALKVRDA